MSAKSPAVYAIAAVLIVAAVIVAVVFDSPTSVFILVGISLVGMAIATAAGRTSR